MAYTIKTTTSDLYTFPTFDAREDAAKCARQHVKVEIALQGGQMAAYSEPAYNDQGDISFYTVIRRYQHDHRGHVAASKVARVSIVEV